MPMTKRLFLALGAPACIGMALLPRGVQADEGLAGIERRHGGRLGVAILGAGGRSAGYRENERFLLCSTFKLLLVAQLLAEAEAGKRDLAAFVRYKASDLPDYAPVTKAHAQAGGMRVRDLCAAAMVWSDNGAANLLYGISGGPAALTRFIRASGDPVTRCDRLEPALNDHQGELDTTTPRAMARTMRLLLAGPTLGAAARAQLAAWMGACETGRQRLRAGFPPSWAAGDKTGTGPALEANDVAFARAPGGEICVTAYYEAPDKASRDLALRDVGAYVGQWV